MIKTSVCLSVRVLQVTVFLPRSLIFGHNTPCDMRKKNKNFVFRNFDFWPLESADRGPVLATQVGLLPETQCGFRHGRGTIDMIFTARQLQESAVNKM